MSSDEYMFSDNDHFNEVNYDDQGKIYMKKKRGRPKGSKNKVSKPKRSLPGGALITGRDQHNDIKDKKKLSVPLYEGFMLSIRPLSNPYFNTFNDQRKKVQEIIDIIWNTKISGFILVRYDANIEMKTFRRIFYDLFWIHGHVLFTFHSCKFPYQYIKDMVETHFGFLFTMGDVKMTVGKEDHYNAMMQYIYKYRNVHAPWSETKDMIEYGEEYLKDKLYPIVTINEDEKDTWTIYTNSEEKRYLAAQRILCLYAKEKYLVYDTYCQSLIDPISQNRYFTDDIMEEILIYPHMSDFVILKKYISSILTVKNNEYLSEKFIKRMTFDDN